MKPLIAGILLVVSVPLALTQVTSPAAPAAVVVEHAQQVLSESKGSACETACATIAKAIPNGFFLRDAGLATAGLWDAKQSELIPACRVQPSTPEEVSLILQAAVEQQCHFAVRGGGHSRIAGSSNAEDGITIDLRKFDAVEIAKDRKTVRVGGGSVWGDVYRVLEKENLMVVGGRVADVGVGGLILGGGISFLSNKHGWAADSVTAFEVVLPDTSVATITHKSSPDLFWALRGGGNNFGVVTAFHLEAVKMQPRMWKVDRGYSSDKMPELLKAQKDFVTNVQAKDPDAVGWFPYGYIQQYDMFISFIQGFHLSHEDNTTWPASFKAFEAIEGVPDTTSLAVKPMSDCTEDIVKMNPVGMRSIYKTITYRASAAVDQKIIETYQKLVERVKHVEAIMPVIVFHPTPPGHTKHMSKNGGNPLGLAGEGPLTIMQTAWSWKNKEDDAINFKANEDLFEDATRIAKGEGVLLPYVYQNYAWQGQDVFAGYGAENQERLKAIQKKIDPNGIFAGGEGLSRGYFKVNVKDAEVGSDVPSRDEL